MAHPPWDGNKMRFKYIAFPARIYSQLQNAHLVSEIICTERHSLPVQR